MIKNLLQEGFALKEKGHYKHAIEVYYKALELDNTSSELLLEIADVYFRMGNEERALNYIEQILDKEPVHVPSLKLLEKIFISKGALEEAEQTAKNIYCITRDASDLAEIFKLLNQQGKFDEIFEYNIEESSNDSVYLEKARAYYFRKEFDKAEALLNDKNFLDNQQALLLLGKIYFAQNKKDKCVSLLNNLRIDETNPELLNFVGLIETYRENYNKAVSFFKEAIKLNRSSDDYYFNIANVYFKQGDFYLAKKFYNLALSLAPDNKNYHFALANLYYSEKHYKKALEELKGNFFEARLLKAVILYDTGYLTLAQKELNKLEEERPDNTIIKEYKTRIEADLQIT